MSQQAGLNRRAFLKSAGMTALAGAVGPGTSLASAAGGVLQGGGSRYDFDTPYNRLGTDSTKWDAALRTVKEAGGTDLVAGMGIADMDFKTAPEITKALMDRIQHENWGYLDMPKSFVEGIVAWNKRRYNVTVNPEMVGITTGVHPGLIAALKAFSRPGSKVLLLTPGYSGFYTDLRESGTIAEESPLKYANGRYDIDFEDFERRIAHDTHAMILCNPQNPTGNCWSRADLMTLGRICLRRRVVVLADEIHCDFVNKGQTYTPFSTLEDRDVVMNSLTFKAASKSFSLAAMKCAWFFTDNKQYFDAVRAQNRADLSTLGMIAAKAAYAEGEAWLNQCVSYIDANHDFAQSYINANMPLVKIGNKAEGTYLMWLDVTQVADRIGAAQQAAEETRQRPAGARPVTTDMIVQRWFAKNAGVVLNAGAGYGAGGENRMRMNIATSRKTLEQALAGMANALKRGATSTAAV